MKQLTPLQDHYFKTLSRCPFCQTDKGLLKGPEGGLSMNVKCANEECGAEINFMGPFKAEILTPPSKFVQTDLAIQEEIVAILWAFAGKQQSIVPGLPDTITNEKRVTMHLPSLGEALEQIMSQFSLGITAVE